MAKLFIEDLPITGNRVLMRVDFNVPLNSEGRIADATRIEAALPSIRYVLDQGGTLILMSHLGRPNNAPNPRFSLKPVARILEALIERPVTCAPDCVGEEVEDLVNKLQPGEVLLLENLRFHRGETHPEEDPDFAKALASYGDFYVNDAFGTAHRKHSSTYTVAGHFPGKAAAGYLLQKEIHFLGEILSNPERPFYALLGGAKISTKIGVVKSLLEKVDRLLIGGGMSYTFFQAQGISVGDSPVEEEFVPFAKELLETQKEKLLLPTDIVIAKECSENVPTQIIDIAEGIPPDFQGLDIGPKTREAYCAFLSGGKTLLWNGPVGVYELDTFAGGTLILAAHFGTLDATTIVGGGDLVAAIKKAGVEKKITHISTGGGATLEFIERGSLPALDLLTDV